LSSCGLLNADKVSIVGNFVEGTAGSRAPGRHHMRYLARLNADPAVWLLILIAGGVIGTLLYVVLTSITF